MKKFIVVGAGTTISAAATAAVLFGAGVAAAAPDVVGETYADAASAISDDGGTVVVATRVGSKLPQDECIVTNVRDQSALRYNGEDVYADNEVMLTLNCDGGYATATNPGASLASPAGRKAKAAADEAAAEEEAAALAEVSTPDE